jgi:oligoendopeptidase F
VIYGGLLADYYGGAALIDEKHRLTWARVPHFYESPYHVYRHATCVASSAKLYRDMFEGPEAERPAAVARYLELLRSGGNDHPMEQLKKAVVDLAAPATVRAVVDEMARLVERLEREAELLPKE